MVDTVQEPPVEDKGTAAPTKDVAPSTEEKVSDYEKQMLEKFKNPKDMLKYGQEIQAFATRVVEDKKAVVQEKEALLAENAKLKEAMAQFEDLQQYQVGQPTTSYETPYDQGGDAPQAGYYTKDDLDALLTTREINKVAMRERMKDPEHFLERWGMVQRLGFQYPQLTYSDQGVEKLFEIADKRLKEMTKEMAVKSLDTLLADEDAKQKVREMVLGEKPPASTGAYMPETTTSTRTGLPPEKVKDLDAEIQEARDRGDYETVTKLEFDKLMKD